MGEGIGAGRPIAVDLPIAGGSERCERVLVLPGGGEWEDAVEEITGVRGLLLPGVEHADGSRWEGLPSGCSWFRHMTGLQHWRKAEESYERMWT